MLGGVGIAGGGLIGAGGVALIWGALARYLAKTWEGRFDPHGRPVSSLGRFQIARQQHLIRIGPRLVKLGLSLVVIGGVLLAIGASHAG